MPAAFAASITRVPGAAVTAFPSIVSFTGSAIALNSFRSHRGRVGTPRRAEGPRTASCGHHFVLVGARFAVQMIFEFAAELLHDGEGGHSRGIAQRAESAAHHVARNIADQVDVALGAAARVEAVENLAEPGSTFAAGNAPSAAFMRIEAHDPQGR